VAKDDPVDVGILELLRRDLAGVGAIAAVKNVLCRDLD